MPDPTTPPGATPGSTPPPSTPPAGATPDVAELTKKLTSLEAYIEELKSESITNRQKAKASSSVIDNLRTALGIDGDAAAVEAKVKDAVVARDATIKKLVLGREIERAAVKAGLKPHLLERAASLVSADDVEVDVATQKITKGDLNAKFTDLAKTIPELFGATPSSPPAPKPPAGTQDPGTPPPVVSGSVIEQWQTATAKQDRQAMAKLMREHGREIGAYVDSLPKRV